MKSFLMFHVFAFICGYFLDIFSGDPENLPFPHLVRIYGKLIEGLEKRLYFKDGKRALYRGGLLVFTALITVLFSGFFMLFFFYKISVILFLAFEIFITWQVLATKSLNDACMDVHKALSEGGTKKGAQALSMIVGRDTENLSDGEIIKAAIESCSENTSDGVIAPLIYTAFLGTLGGMVYKLINTMDSMLGYKNEKYLYFGLIAARLDDIVNFVPARVSALLMVITAYIMPGFSGKRAFAIWRRDGRKHESPNSAQSMSACAGALGVQLGGRASYFGKIKEKPFLGDEVKRIEVDDIKRSCRLMRGASFIGFIVCVIGLLFLTVIRVKP